MNDLSREKLLELVAKWKRRALKSFADSELEQDAMGKRLIEHGAVCIANCMLELEEAIGEL